MTETGKMTKPYPIKAPHTPFAKAGGKYCKIVPRGAGGSLEKEESTIPPEVLELFKPPRAGVLLAKLALPLVVSPGTLNAADQPSSIPNGGQLLHVKGLSELTTLWAALQCMG